jgi:hypothetical protein
MSELESDFIEKCFTYLEREAKRKEILDRKPILSYDNSTSIPLLGT